MTRDRRTVPVWVDEWQYACCGDPFTVGDRVTWTLGPADQAFLAPLLGPHLPGWAGTLPDRGTARAGDGREVVVAGEGDLSVLLPGADPTAARHPVGLLAEDRHDGFGAAGPPTVGWVRTIRVVHPGAEPAPVRSSTDDPGGAGFLVELDVRC